LEIFDTILWRAILELQAVNIGFRRLKLVVKQVNENNICIAKQICQRLILRDGTTKNAEKETELTGPQLWVLKYGTAYGG
jgi:hypothetical protein